MPHLHNEIHHYIHELEVLEDAVRDYLKLGKEMGPFSEEERERIHRNLFEVRLQNLDRWRRDILQALQRDT